MRDPYLAEIIRAVERSGEPVAVSLALVSGAVVTGYVRDSRTFTRLTRAGSDTLRQRLTPPKDDYQRGLLAQLERTQAAVEVVREEVDQETSTFVTLSDVSMVWSNGDGLRLPVIRVNVDTTTAWWLTPGQPIKGSKDTSGFFAVGVAF